MPRSVHCAALLALALSPACAGGDDGAASTVVGPSSGGDTDNNDDDNDDNDAAEGSADDSDDTTADPDDDAGSSATDGDTNADEPPGDTNAGSTGNAGTTRDDSNGSSGVPDEPPPTDAAALQTWLAEGNYLDWPAESAPHASTGPHFGTVRTFVNPAMLGSLEAGGTPHPVDAAAVKELYGNGQEVRGWSVLVKVSAGEGGDTWYFLEVYDDTVFGDGVGDGSCTGCHGVGSVDYFKSPFPLQ